MALPDWHGKSASGLQGEPDPCDAHAVRQAFEKQWKFSTKPSLKAFLGNVPDPEIGLLRDLIKIDMQHRCAIGDTLSLSDYLLEFPELGVHRELLTDLAQFELTLRTQGRIERVVASELNPSTRSDLGVVTPHDPADFALNLPVAKVLSQEEKPLPAAFGRYSVRRRQGEGGFGTVYYGHDSQLQRAVAIKVPRRDSLTSEDAVNQFLQEARRLARLKHPGIVTVYDVNVQDGQCYIVSDFVEGTSLSDWLKKRRPSWEEATTIVAAIADALAYAHSQRVVHRDVKPANVLLTKQGLPVLVDFGLAISEGEATGEQRGHVQGTLVYMSPEQARGEGHRIDGRTDIYSLGAMLYQMLCGRLPFRGNDTKELLRQVRDDEPQPPRQLIPELPRELERICLKAMAKRMEDRYTTAGDMAAELRAALAPPPVAAAESGPANQRAGAEAGTGQAARSPDVPVAVRPDLAGATPAAAAPERPARPDPTKYLRSLLDLTQYIDIRGLQVGTGKAYRFPIEDLFITLSSVINPGKAAAGTGRVAEDRSLESDLSDQSQCWLHEALAHRRLVIIGDPGSGKTTFLRRIVSSLCQVLLEHDVKAAERRLGITDRPFPLFLRLAEVAEHIAASRRMTSASMPTTSESAAWLPHYMAVMSVETNLGLDENFFRAQLESGNAILLLDGLDEAPTRAARVMLSKMIENAARAFDKCRVVVTSRPSAYTGEAVLVGFAHAEIGPLGDAAIDTFLVRWCEYLFPDNPVKAAKHRDELVMALRYVPDIRRMARNPVMLTALAVVHWNEKRLPEQRADLYESIITWLSRSREQRAGRLPSERCVSLLQNLAMAMQDHPSGGRQVQVPKRWAAETIASALRDVPAEARVESAERFLTEEELDSGIVVGRGDQVRFWHLTFQEFLAARALAGRSDRDQRGILFSQQKFYSPEWREVVLLMAGVLHRQGVEKVDGMFAAILDQLGKKTSFSDAARCAGLLGAVLRDLGPLRYKTTDARFDRLLQGVLGIFDPKRSQTVPLDVRIQAADALGKVGDPRLMQQNWILMLAGRFFMGAQREDRVGPNFEPEASIGLGFGMSEKPVHEVSLEAYEISRYPVTVAEYQRFIDEDGYRDPRWWKAGGFGEWTEPKDWLDQVAYPNRPIVGVSWFEAAAYCLWGQLRLPTEAEWERAARGTEGRPFPWGAEPADPSRLNFEAACVNRPTPVGVFPLGATPDGLQDMAGNVWEWVADWAGSYSGSSSANPRGPDEGTLKIFRGGCWSVSGNSCRCAFRANGSPVSRGPILGFRTVNGR